MYKIQKIRSRKLIHNISLRYKQQVIRAIRAAHRENINNKAKMLCKSDNNRDSEENNSCNYEQQVHCIDNYNVESDNFSCLSTETIHEKVNEQDAICNLSNKNTCEKLNETISFEKKLASVFIQSSFNFDQCNAILKLLKTHTCFSNLPSDARTILQTFIYINIIN